MPPQSDKLKRFVEYIAAIDIEVSAFGGGNDTSFSLALLLGKVSHLNKLEPAPQLEELLSWLAYFNPDWENLRVEAAQKVWEDSENQLELPKDEEDLHQRIGKYIALEIAKGFVDNAEDCRKAGENFFALGMDWGRELMFLAPSGNANLTNMKALFELSPFGSQKFDSHTQTLLQGGYWTCTEFYADMLEQHLRSLDATIKVITQTDNGWAGQHEVPAFREASLQTPAKFIRKVTKALLDRAQASKRLKRSKTLPKHQPLPKTQPVSNKGRRRMPSPSKMLSRSRAAPAPRGPAGSSASGAAAAGPSSSSALSSSSRSGPLSWGPRKQLKSLHSGSENWKRCAKNSTSTGTRPTRLGATCCPTTQSDGRSGRLWIPNRRRCGTGRNAPSSFINVFGIAAVLTTTKRIVQAGNSPR